jgi:hypothetical protein
MQFKEQIKSRIIYHVFFIERFDELFKCSTGWFLIDLSIIEFLFYNFGPLGLV